MVRKYAFNPPKIRFRPGSFFVVCPCFFVRRPRLSLFAKRTIDPNLCWNRIEFRTDLCSLT
jgi:hypothetical protein